MRDLILNEPHPTETQKREILEYCASDVIGTEALLRYMAERRQIDWPRALRRGRYVIAAARMERNGTPIDIDLHARLSRHWPALRRRIVAEVSHQFPVFDENDSFKENRFEQFVINLGIPWPVITTKDGREELALDKKTFDDMCRFHPELRPLYETRESLGKTRLTGISVGSDGRNRCLLSVFQSATGRNQPSNSKFIFGPAKWMRGLISPPSGYGLAYVDWQAQEVAIAAALSGCERMIEAYLSGDVHFAFAKAAGLAPPDAVPEGNEAARDIAKTIVLGINYGMGPVSMATRAGVSKREARFLLAMHRIVYRKFWQWADGIVNTALFAGEMTTKYGWRRRVLPDPNVRSLQNWPVQSTGAEMLRAAAIAVTECGIEVCCPVHDAFLIAAPLDRLERDVALARQILEMAADCVIGLRVRTDVKRVLPPDRYMDKRGQEMWDRVTGLLREVEEP
jgi:DNA polymerase I